MERSQSSHSDATSFNQSYSQMEGPLCHCNRSTVLAKSWTDDNPGRRFFKCDVHGFFVWADKEKPYGWQKVSLLEARDQIRRQKEEIKELKEATRRGEGRSGANGDSSTAKTDLLNKITDYSKKLEFEAIGGKEREKLLRQFFVLSWGGFIVVIGMILTMLKK